MPDEETFIALGPAFEALGDAPSRALLMLAVVKRAEESIGHLKLRQIIDATAYLSEELDKILFCETATKQ